MKVLREPLVHFLVLGAVLFVVFGVLGDRTTGTQHRIVIPAGLVENLSLSFTRNNSRPPSGEELDRLIDEYVREEILSREARALGLDRDDPVIRQRLRQRMEFLAETNTGSRPAPSEEELHQFFERNADAFKRSDGTLPDFGEVRAAVERRWTSDRLKESLDTDYKKLRGRYTVSVERPKTK